MLLKYKCNLCDNSITKYFKSKKDVTPFFYCECGGVLEKQIPNFGVSSVEIVDNGNMSRRVELKKDAIKNAKEKGDKYIEKMESRESVFNKDKK